MLRSLFLLYLKIFAKIQLFKIRATVIGIGGAAGKTSLASIVSTILRNKYSVLETKGKNSETGIPLSILGIDMKDYSLPDWLRVAALAPIKVFLNWKRYDFFIAEMGIDGPDEPKNMSYLLKIVKPKIGVLTNVALEHSEYFDNAGKGALDAIAKEELLLLKSLPKDGLAVINKDDSRIVKVNLNCPKVTVSSIERADFFIKKVRFALNSFEVNFDYNGDEYKISLKTSLPKYFAFTIISALAISQKLGFSVQEALEILQRNFNLPPGRFSVFQGIRNSIIIDSSYNSSPVALSSSLELLSEIANGRRRVAILGDMRELGKESMEEHRKIGKLIIENTDFAILIGPQISEFTAPALTKSKHKFLIFPSFSSAQKEILENIKDRDLVLVKSSQNTLYLERVVEMLLENPKDKEKLPRRGKFWDKKRKETN